MKPLRSILIAGLALAFLGMTARAVTFQVVDDTAGSSVTDKIAKANGKATTLHVSAKSTAYISFDVGGSGINPQAVTGARLVIYFQSVTKPGSLILSANGSPGFTESFPTPTIPTPPSAGTIGSPIAVTTADAKNFLTIDVTSQVISWLTNAGTDFGFGIAGDATVNLLIGSKEGSGSGYPAVLEVDVNGGAAGTVAGSSGNFNTSIALDLSAEDNGTVGSGLVFGGPPSGPGGSGEGIASDRVGTSSRPNQFGLDFYTDSVQRLSITQDGKVGIGTTTPTVALEVDGDALVDGNFGIGTTMPTVRLEVNGDAMVNGELKATGTEGALSFLNRNDQTDTWQWHADSTGARLQEFGGTAGSPLVINKSGEVGIGTSTPSTRLEVDGTITAKPNAGNYGFVADNGSATINLGLNGSNTGLLDNTNGPLAFETNGAIRMSVLGDGRVGIGTAAPSALLEVNGGIKCIGAVDTSSDARYKLNIQPLSGALAQTLRLRGVSYDWNRAKFPDKGFDDRHQLGFIAQEVRGVLPDVVSEDRDGYLSIGYTAIIPVLAEAVKELKQHTDAEVATLQADNAALKASNAALAQKLTVLEARDAAREARLTKLENALDERPARPITAALELK